MARVFFVCSGNTCRSPMALDIFRQVLTEKGRDDVHGDSFGIKPHNDDPGIKANREHAVRTVMGTLADRPDHRPKGISRGLVGATDTVIVLHPDYEKRLKQQLSEKGANPKAVIVWKIKDPYERGETEYVKAAREMRVRIEQEFDSIVGP